MLKTAYILLIIACLQTGIPLLALAQSNQSETLTITTYYPSPYGVYRNLEVKRGLAVGDITKGPVGNMNNLQAGQLYINSSVILNALSTYPPAPWRPGQLIYYVSGTDKMIKYYNGTDWVNFTGSSSIPVCGSSNAQILNYTPTTDLCTAGTASIVSGSGPWTWSCTLGAASALCMAVNPAALPSATCGSSSGQSLASAPTANLCASGTASTVSGSGPWTWNCVIGPNSKQCSANKCAALPHYPPKNCWVGTICEPSHPACGCISVNNGCTTPEGWGTGGTCTFPTYSCFSYGHLRYGWVTATGICTQTDSDDLSCH